MRQETHNETNIYTYDIARRLISVDGVTYSWDDNGNLLADGDRRNAYPDKCIRIRGDHARGASPERSAGDDLLTSVAIDGDS